MDTGNTVYRYRELYTELEDYEKHGVCMLMEGSKASPLQIVTAHMIREEGSYMRDYILDPQGYIKSLIFVKINQDNQAEDPLTLPDRPQL